MSTYHELSEQLSNICSGNTLIIGIGNPLKGDDGAVKLDTIYWPVQLPAVPFNSFGCTQDRCAQGVGPEGRQRKNNDFSLSKKTQL